MGIIQQVGDVGRRALYGSKTRTEMTLTATPTLSPEVITLTRLTVSRAGVIVNWGDGGTTTLPVGSTVAVTHSYATAGTYNIVVSDATAITQLRLESAKIGNLDTAQLRNSAIAYFYVTLITGSIIKSADMAAWTPTEWRLFSMPAGGTYNISSADMTAWSLVTFQMCTMPAGSYTINTAHMTTWPMTGTFFISPGISGDYTITTADMATWRPTVLLLSMSNSGSYTINSSHIAGWRPVTVSIAMSAGGTYTINTSDFSAWSPQTYQIFSMAAGTYTFGAAVMRNWTNAQAIRCDGLGLNQATVDAILFDIYAGRMGYTYATPTLNVGGTNATPSGVYADEDPPVTGKGAAFELQNDPEAEGFSRWAITFTP